MKKFPRKRSTIAGAGVRTCPLAPKPATNKGATADSGLSSGCKTVVSLANDLHPLDTCHGKEQVRAIHQTSLVIGPSPQGCGPSFQSHRAVTLVAKVFLAMVVLTLVGMSFLDGPYWPKIEDYYNGAEVVR